MTTARPNCTKCLRPLHEFPHATFTLDDGGEYHGEVRSLADGFANVYVPGYSEFHVKASRVVLTDEVDARAVAIARDLFTRWGMDPAAMSGRFDQTVEAVRAGMAA